MARSKRFQTKDSAKKPGFWSKYITYYDEDICGRTASYECESYMNLKMKILKGCATEEC